MKILIIALFTLIHLVKTDTIHDAIATKFRVIERGAVLFLEIEFDEENLVKLNKTKSLYVTKEEFEKYLHETTNWVFDNEKLTPKILSIQTDGHHKKAICFLSKQKKNIKSIRVKNEFFLDIETHINIVMFDINNTSKDFELDKGRKEILVNYK